MWTEVVEPAVKESRELSDKKTRDALNKLIITYQPSIIRLIRLQQNNLTEDKIQDLSQQFVVKCYETEFLKNVDRSKGRFRDFLGKCLTRFLVDQKRRKKIPGVGKNDVEIDTGHEGEGTYQIPAEDSEDWLRALDQSWAMVVESSALKQVESHMDRGRLASGLRTSLLKRLTARQDDKITLKSDANQLGVSEVIYNNLYYNTYRPMFRKAVREHLERECQPSELEDEFNHFIKVLAGIRRAESI